MWARGSGSGLTVVLQLEVTLDTGLVDRLSSAATAADGDTTVFLTRLHEEIRLHPVLGAAAASGGDPADWFSIDAMVGGLAFWERQLELCDYLCRHLEVSVDALHAYLPTWPGDAVDRLTVHVIPGFDECYGPAPHTQVFGLRDGCSPAEALLFLVHVYYHELSHRFYTTTSHRAAEGGDDPDTLRHWLLLLIQNEGLANHAVREQVLQLRAEGVPLRYFTYADRIGDRRAVATAMEFCRRLLADLDGWRDYGFRSQITALLKSPQLPVINLVGIHVAEAVADTFGDDVLLTSFREPEELFELYARTGDDLCIHLFGEPATTAGWPRRSPNA